MLQEALTAEAGEPLLSTESKLVAANSFTVKNDLEFDTRNKEGELRILRSTLN